MPKYYIPSPEEIRQTRRVADLTQAEAADECRITPTSWARYEQGHHAMPPSIWRLFNYVLEEQERDAKYSEPVEKPKKLTVYEMKQQREAEEQRKEMEAQRRRDERIQQREQERQDFLAELQPQFDHYKDLLRIKFNTVDRDFAKSEGDTMLMQEAIRMMRETYLKYEDEINQRIEGTWVEPTWSDTLFDD